MVDMVVKWIEIIFIFIFFAMSTNIPKGDIMQINTVEPC